MKIYTRTGDLGITSLFGGKKVEKSSKRIRAYGEVDELNSLIGMIIWDLHNYGLSRFDSGVASLPRMTNNGYGIKKKLLRIQSELFVLGSDLATPIDVSNSLELRGASKIPRITKSFIVRLEKEIDAWSNKLPQLRNFIIPGGSAVGSKLHLARTVARRAERSIVALSSDDKINKNAQIYINRLSDWFFTLARLVNQIEDAGETPWQGRSKT